MQNLIGMFTFFGLDLKYLFWAYLIQKLKIISSKWNLIPTTLDKTYWNFRIFQKFPHSPNFNVALGWKSVPNETTLHSTTLKSGERRLLLKKIGIYSKITKIFKVPNIMSEVEDEFEFAEFNSGIHCICLRLEILFLGRFGPKIKNC